MGADQAAVSAVRHTAEPASGKHHAPVKPVIIMLSGLPGTGKSYLAGRLAGRLHFMIVESDAVRKELFPTPTYSARESSNVFNAVHYLIEDLLHHNTSVIFDATNLDEKHRKKVYRIAEQYKTRLILVEVAAPPEIVKKRLKARLLKRSENEYSDATWAVYQKMKGAAEKISRPHLTVNTAGDIISAIDSIVNEVNRG
jgi:predicted kinase